MREFKQIKKTLNDLQYASKIPSLDAELEEVEKHLKALEIMAEKDVDIFEIKRSIDVQQYNSNHFSTSKDLSKDEFNIVEYALRRY